MKILSLLFFAICLLLGCGNDAPKPTSQPKQSPVTAAQQVPAFDGASAFKFLTAQTDFGPRTPNSAGHRNCLSYLQSELSKYAEAVNLQSFTVNGYNGETLSLTNVIVSFNLQATTRILLVAHWDTRPRADQEKDPKNQDIATSIQMGEVGGRANGTVIQSCPRATVA